MSTLLNGQAIQDLVVLGMFVVGILVAYKISKSSRLPADTIKNLKESNESLIGLNATREAEIKKLAEEVHANDAAHSEEVLKLNKEISVLEGQIKVYKELPLRELADGIKEVVKLSRDNANINKQVLEVLSKKAEIDAEDRDVLTNQNKHIASEVDRRMDQKNVTSS
jgi:hypothetical protein